MTTCSAHSYFSPFLPLSAVVVSIVRSEVSILPCELLSLKCQRQQRRPPTRTPRTKTTTQGTIRTNNTNTNTTTPKIPTSTLTYKNNTHEPTQARTNKDPNNNGNSNTGRLSLVRSSVRIRLSVRLQFECNDQQQLSVRRRSSCVTAQQRRTTTTNERTNACEDAPNQQPVS